MQARDQRPLTRDKGQERGTRHETRDKRQETRDKRQETRDKRHEARGKRHETRVKTQENRPDLNKPKHDQNRPERTGPDRTVHHDIRDTRLNMATIIQRKKSGRENVHTDVFLANMFCTKIAESKCSKKKKYIFVACFSSSTIIITKWKILCRTIHVI
jgi:hypothetical protein